MKRHFKSPKCKVLDQPDVKDTLHKLHANYVLVPADKAANNVIIVCKKYYIDTLVKELGINNVNINNPTYIPIDDSFETIVKSHNQFITTVGLEMSEEDQNLLYLYWTPKLHKSPYKHRFIAGSSKCMTNNLSCPLTNVEHLVVLLAGPLSHTSTQYTDFVDFLHFTGFVYHLFYSF